jgi:hypothetical protein
VTNLVARLFSIGLGLGILAQFGLACLPLSSVQVAALGGSAVSAAQTRYPSFRPILRGGSPSGIHSPALLPRGRVTPAFQSLRGPALARAGRIPPLAHPRAGMRKAEPATRGQELGLRFRPDERESPYYGQSAPPPGSWEGGAAAAEAQAQFRPTERKRKPSYEELQSEASPPVPPVGPMLPYPSMLPPPLPGYGGYWR